MQFLFVIPISNLKKEFRMEGRKLVLVGLLGAVIAITSCGKSEPKAEATPSAGQIVAAVAGSTSTAGPTDMGIAIYPGAETLMAPHPLTGDASATMYDSAFKSADKPEKVAAFYRDELGKLFGDKSKIAEPPMGEGFVHLVAGDGVSKNFDIVVRPEGTDTIFSIKTIVKAN